MRIRILEMQLAVLTIASLCLVRPLTAGEINLPALTQETQKLSQSQGGMTLVWWIPEEFWKASLSQQKQLSAEQVDGFLKVMKPYIVVVVAKGKIGLTSTFKSEEFLRANTKLIDSQGHSCAPLSDSDVDGSAKMALSMIKPMFANTMGMLGRNMHILIFSAKTADGQQIVDTKKRGQFKVTVAGEQFRWRLPFDSVLPKQTCPKCKEACKGSWQFCPWCGTKLKK